MPFADTIDGSPEEATRFPVDFQEAQQTFLPRGGLRTPYRSGKLLVK